MARAWIGTSGFSYPTGGACATPRGCRSAVVRRYAEAFNAVELNVTFHRLPRPEAFAGWAAQVPGDFRFVRKGSRQVTHVQRLRGGTPPVRRLLRNARPLGQALRALLWQLRPFLGPDMPRLERFLRDLGAASPGQVQHAIEFRHPDWFAAGAPEAVLDAGGAVGLADAPLEVLPPRARRRRRDLPAVRVPEPRGWAYVRRHGPGGHDRGTARGAIRSDAVRIAGWAARGVEVLAFDDNDLGGHAVHDAAALRRALGPLAAQPGASAAAGLTAAASPGP